ncbi:MAG TPA: trypsin-like peptidase domain-containing protein [Candidatus Dormibacteraeota bacterium]|nr:trypsin-like peptidase domain-containing protein [Candidatus Dormibacteraeota bacterium]
MSEQQPDDQGSGLTPPPEPPGAPTAWMPPPPTMPPPATSVWHRIAAYVVLVAVVAAAAGIGVGYSIARAVNPQQAAQASPITLVPGSSASPATNGNGNNNNSNGSTSVASKVEPAIVRIHTTVGSSAAAGTGMIISSNGEILTNNHVVSSSTSISVQVQGRSQTYTAHVVGVAVSQDVAVIQIDQNVSGLPTVKFADSSGVQVGDPVVAIGNALDNGTQANSGQVTAVDQTITASEGGGSSETLSGMIESDAIIYEGDSGGALVNSSGQVIGMITAGQAQGFRSSASSVGYAIQSNTAVGIADRIRNHEQASDLTYGQVGYLGVQVQTLDAAAAQQLNLNVTSGALVVQVQPGSPAASGGLTRNSVITSLGGTTITSADDLGTAIRSHQPGDRVSFTWVNSGGTHTATVALGGVNP